MASSSSRGPNAKSSPVQARMLAYDDNDALLFSDGYNIKELRQRSRRRHPSISSVRSDDLASIEIIERDEAEVDAQEQGFIDLTEEDDEAPYSAEQYNANAWHSSSRHASHPPLSYRVNGIDLRVGDFVELAQAVGAFDAQFVEIKEIWADDRSPELMVRGIPYTRTRNLGGQLETKRNEVCQIVESLLHARQPEEQQGLITVQASQILLQREFHKTNTAFPLCRFGNDMEWTMRSTDDKENQAPLTCRWKMRAVYADAQHLKAARAHSTALVPLAEAEVPCPAYRTSDLGKLEGWLGRSLKVRAEYTAGDAFCGAGGASRGATMAGFKVTVAIDNWPVACRSYRRNFPNTRLYNDHIMDFVNNNETCRVDILHISPPCQFFSPAHTHQGQNDEANTAALLVCADLIKKMRPRLVTLEQTHGLTHERHAPFFNALIQAFTSNKYSVQWRVVPLVSYGLPQNRKRLIMIGAAPGSPLPSWPPATHGLGVGMKPYVTESKAIDRMPRHVSLHDIRSVRRVNGGVPRRPDVPLPRTITCGGVDGMVHYSGLRDYTPRELACLQGFPMHHVFEGDSRGAIKKQIGNAFPPCVVRVIYSHLRAWLQQQDSPARNSVVSINGDFDEDIALERALQESRRLCASSGSVESWSGEREHEAGRGSQPAPEITVLEISDDEVEQELPGQVDRLSVANVSILPSVEQVSAASPSSSTASSVTLDFSPPSSPTLAARQRQTALDCKSEPLVPDRNVEIQGDDDQVEFLHEVRRNGTESSLFNREASVPSREEGNRVLAFSKRLQKLPVTARDGNEWNI